MANRRQSYFIDRKVTFEKLVSSQELILLSKIKSKCDGTPYVHFMIIHELHERVKANTLKTADVRGRFI